MEAIREKIDKLKAKSKKVVRAPFKLVMEVMELGRDPLYAHMLTKLNAFKDDDRYKNSAHTWWLIEDPGPGDVDRLTPEQLYESIMRRSHICGSALTNFEDFLLEEYGDRYSWQCMRWLEKMMEETTSYEHFMFCFDTVIDMISQDSVPFFVKKKSGETLVLLGLHYMDYKLSPEELEESAEMWKEEKKRIKNAEKAKNEVDKDKKKKKKEKE